MLLRRILAAAGLLIAGTTAGPRAVASDVDFNRDIRPILSRNCFDCHGPDSKQRKADLRLDIKAGAFADLGGHAAFVAGKPNESEALRRILSDDADEQMPPPTTGKKPTAAQIELIRQWITQGAKWSEHWSYIPPTRPSVPKIRERERSRNAVDRFILARLEQENLKSSPEADRVTLLRRLSLDLIGLPPTLSEVDSFLADKSPDALHAASRSSLGVAALRRTLGSPVARRGPLCRFGWVRKRQVAASLVLPRLGHKRAQS